MLINYCLQHRLTLQCTVPPVNCLMSIWLFANSFAIPLTRSWGLGCCHCASLRPGPLCDCSGNDPARLQPATTHSNFDTLQCILNLSCMRLQHACSNTYTKHILLWWPWAVNAAGFSFQPYVCVVTIDITAQPCTLVKGSQQQNYSQLKFQERI